MNNRNYYFFFFIIFLIGVSCSSSKNFTKSYHLEELVGLMSGSFNSEAQANIDSNYYNISLRMYPVWEGESDRWLYVEQAVISMQDKPYRQRIYKINQLGPNEFVSAVYRLKNEKEFIGKWDQPEYFNQFDKSILEIREGCEVYLERKGPQFYAGSTKDKTCKSSLRGATYANSIVKIEKNKVESWDQGFDGEDVQVWGAMQGPYIFDKLEK
jgi:hypothetical protein